VHFDRIAVDCGGSIGGVPPRVGVEMNEGENEGVQEKCDASMEAGGQRVRDGETLVAHLNIMRMYVT
jgi:hypothetical protein